MFLNFFRKKKAKLRESFNNVDALIKDLKRLSKLQSLDKSELMQKHLLLIAGINNLIIRTLDRVREPAYVLSSLFLQDCFNFLNRQEEESMHFVTGVEIGETKILDRIVPFKISMRSVVGAQGDSIDVNRVLIQMDELKLKLLGYFHIHPGCGPNSNFPSVVDQNLENLLERGNYQAIGAIFSRDGFIRFHSPRHLNIQIYGEGVEKINDRLYHLVKVG